MNIACYGITSSFPFFGHNCRFVWVDSPGFSLCLHSLGSSCLTSSDLADRSFQKTASGVVGMIVAAPCLGRWLVGEGQLNSTLPLLEAVIQVSRVLKSMNKASKSLQLEDPRPETYMQRHPYTINP